MTCETYVVSPVMQTRCKLLRINRGSPLLCLHFSIPFWPLSYDTDTELEKHLSGLGANVLVMDLL